MKKRDFGFTRESLQMFPMMGEWEYCGWLFLKGSNQHCFIDQNLLKWNGNIDPLVCLHFCGGRKVTLTNILGAFFPCITVLNHTPT